VVTTLIVAAVCFVVGAGLQLFRGRFGDAQRHSIALLAWLGLALGTVFLLFTFFPTSTVSGSIHGLQMGGAFAAFAFVWWYGSRRAGQLSALDHLQAQLADARKTIRRLESRLAQTADVDRGDVLVEQTVDRYRIAGHRDRELAIVTGDLLNVRFADLWVNSENTNMQMSRYYEQTLSGTIRFYGARRDHAGAVTADDVGDALAREMGATAAVAPGTVLVTTAGELANSHGVRAILHAAAVSGEPGGGYKRIGEIGRCVTNILDRAEGVGGDPPPRSVLIPLFGTGSGKADVESTARLVLTAAVGWLASDRPTNLRTVYVLAYRDSELAACRRFLDGCETVVPPRR
jgi:O-acetyl-ADP-ribose deacetylase (regulator of RNase III)